MGTEAQEAAKQEFEFTAEIKQLLDILVHSLYTQKDIFLRELISNASDALDKLRFQKLTKEDSVAEQDLELSVKISVDKDKNTLTIEDTGIGMNHEEIVENIGTIAHSGSKSFAKAMKEAKDAKSDVNLIGQFGVGFYSAFIVADKVSVTTRSFDKDAKTWCWTSDGTGKYTIEEAKRDTRGTTVTLHLREDDKTYLEDWKLRDVVRKYSDFVSYPVFFDKEQINKLSAIWTRSRNEIKKEEYDEFYKYLAHTQDEFLDHVHLSYDAPIQFYSILFIPKTVPFEMQNSLPEKWKGVHLYARRIFVQSDCEELLPEYLRFVRGVVDSDDLPLNISRETLQQNQIITKIRKNLVKKILDQLTTMADERKDDYESFWRNFGRILKQGCRLDFENKDRIADLLRFNSSFCQKEDELTSLASYVDRIRDGQEEIYYLSGENRQIIEQNPHLEIFRKKGIEVLYLTDPMDDWALDELKEFKEKKLVSADRENISVDGVEAEKKEEDKEDKDEESVPDKAFDDLLNFFKTTLKDRVEDIRESRRLVDSPCCLVSGKDTPGVGMQKLMKHWMNDYQMSKRTLEINRKHPLITQMAQIYADSPREALLASCCHQLLDNLLLLDGSPVEMKELIPRIQNMMEHSVGVLAKKE